MSLFGTTQPELTQFRNSVAAFDPLDLVTRAAALQLVPENADRLMRLYGVAGIAASLPPSTERPRMSATKWRKFLNEPPLSTSLFFLAEDPFNNPFTEILTFHGGSHVVFPGNDDDATFVFRHLAKAIFHSSNPFSNPGFAEEARKLCASVLTISNEIARRANLTHYVLPAPGPQGPVFGPSPEAIGRFMEETGISLQEMLAQNHEQLHPLLVPPGEVIVPAAERFKVLKEAVCFSAPELRRLLGRVGASLETLEPLVSKQGSVRLDELDHQSSPLFVNPILHDGNDRYVVAVPRTLVFALCNALVTLALQHGVQEELADRYRWVVFFTAQQSLMFLGNDLLSMVRPDLSEPSTFEALFSLDGDKVISVLLATDDLQDYDVEKASSGYLNETLTDRLHTRMEKLEAKVLDTLAPNEVLHLILIQGIAPSVLMTSGFLGNPLSSRQLALSVCDLETISLLEAGDQLALWKYAGAQKRVRQRRMVHRVSNQLDEFCHYRRNGHGYYWSDDSEDDTIFIPMGGAGELKREVQERRDFRGVLYTEPNSVVEVTSLYDDASIPIFTPWRGGDLGDKVEVLLEALPLDVWVVGPDELPEDRYRSLYALFADLIAYWLWQLAPGLGPYLKELADYRYQMQVRLELVPDDGWFEARENRNATIRCGVDADANLLLELHSGVTELLESPDNSGEREVMRRVLRGIRDLCAESMDGSSSAPTDEQIEDLLDTHAPLGRKKKLLFLSGERNIEHIDEGLPRHRKVQYTDVSELLDELGEHLSSALSLSVGRIPDARRTEVLGEAVGFLFRELERLVSTLSPERLLETLVAHNERILHEQAQLKLLIPTRIACFGTHSEMVDKLRREVPELNKAGVSCRFLIEYVTARPPQGIRPLSLSVYDRLMAISSEIASLGTMSDSVEFGTADPKLSMLGSGRLGINDELYDASRDQFLEVYLAGEIYRSTVGLERHWREEESNDKSEDAVKLDKATRAEFGMSLTELVEFVAEVANMGLERKIEPKVMPIDEFLDEVRIGLGWDRARVDQAFDLFALRPRSDFLHPPAPFRRVETFPWRFNRELSYLRRPLLVRPTNHGEEVVWGVRLCLRSAGHLSTLCAGGRLKAKTREMKNLISELQDRDAEAFNDRVAEFYEMKSAWTVQRRVKKIAGRRIEREPGQELGDIDVLAVDPQTRTLWAIEVKDLAYARTPAELANELENIFQTKGKKRASVDKHQERVAWLRENLILTLEWLGVSPPVARKRWKVEPLLVVDHELQSPYIAQSSVPVTPYRDLEIWHRRKR